MVSRGDTFVQKSPACKIIDLAKAIGIYLNKKITTNIIGSRHGEKLNETLVSHEEMSNTLNSKNHFIIKRCKKPQLWTL